MSTIPPFLRLTPGLLRTPALDQATGQWSQPWAQYWTRQAEAMVTMMQAAVLGDLTVFTSETPPGVPALARQLDDQARFLLASTAPPLGDAGDPSAAQLGGLHDALQAQLAQLRGQVEALRRDVGLLEALQAQIRGLREGLEALQRLEVLHA